MVLYRKIVRVKTTYILCCNGVEIIEFSKNDSRHDVQIAYDTAMAIDCGCNWEIMERVTRHTVEQNIINGEERVVSVQENPTLEKVTLD